MERAAQDLDRRVRDLIQRVEPDLRHHLDTDRLDRDLVSELYLRLRAVLADGRRPLGRSLTERLALIVFLVIVARSDGGEVPPALLVSLRRTLAREAGEPEAPEEDRPGPGGPR